MLEIKFRCCSGSQANHMIPIIFIRTNLLRSSLPILNHHKYIKYILLYTTQHSEKHPTTIPNHQPFSKPNRTCATLLTFPNRRRYSCAPSSGPSGSSHCSTSPSCSARSTSSCTPRGCQTRHRTSTPGGFDPLQSWQEQQGQQ